MDDMQVEMMKNYYKEVIKERWKELPLELIREGRIVFSAMTTSQDTAIHLAVYSGEDEPLRSLLGAMSRMEGEDVAWQNSSGNTPLHEAAAVGNLAAARVLVEFKKEDLLSLNVYGETPLYRAARCGQLHVVKYFVEECEDFFSRAVKNWIRSSGTPIVHAAIQSEKFDIVLKLVEFDKSLLEIKDLRGKTGLHVLANMPSTFKTGSSMPFLDSILYFLLPSEDVEKYRFCNISKLVNDDESESQSSTLQKDNQIQDIEAAHKPTHPPTFHTAKFWLYFLYCLIWKFIIRGWPEVGKVYKKKRQHQSALRITKMLAQIDDSWKQIMHLPENIDIDSTGVRLGDNFQAPPLFGAPNTSTESGGDDVEKDIKYNDHHETPLLLAAANGITEIVEMIYEAHPQAVEYVTMNQRNILHIAIAHRQKKIFEWIRKKRLIMLRLMTRIDVLGFTALHHVGITKFYAGGTRPGPALQLQEELEWFELVQNEIPALYVMHHSNDKGTAREFFNKTHAKILNDATEWLKKTSESCSAVAVLVATVVFAAAYTVPGGLNDKTGSPVLLSEPIFTVFTVMDIVALASSLTSVVLFLSILTSSFRMDDFLRTLPLKLSLGFQLLFSSVATTMAAFALTIVLTVKSEKKWSMTLLYVAAFFPVTMFIIIQLPLYAALVKNILAYRNKILKFFPMDFITPLFLVPSKFVSRKTA